MGRKHISKSKSSKEYEVDVDDYDNQIDELYRPYLIHSTTYVLLTEQILSLMPSERNVLLTMNEYDLSEINPMHPNTSDSPTHIIIFCIRFIAGDIFQPIGGLLIYKHKDQSLILAECLKAYINDLWKLGLHVVGTVSPPFESFKGMLSHLIQVKDFDTYAGSLIYSVAPIKEIVHIYDIQFLLIKLQNLFKEGDIKFIEASREHRACWNDISLVLNLSSEFKILSNYLSNNKDISRRVHIFTQQVFEQFLELEAQGILSKNAGGSAVLLNCIRSFLQFTELDLVDLNLMCQVGSWTSFADILQNMTFQKSKKRTCTKTKPTTVHTITNPSVRRKIDFIPDENPNVIKSLVENLDDFSSVDELEEDLENIKQDTKSTNNKNDLKAEEKSNKHRKTKSRDLNNAITNEMKSNSVDQTIPKLENNLKKNNSRKPYDKQNITSTKETSTAEIEKTDCENNTNQESSGIKKSVENKFIDKTEDFDYVSETKLDQEKIDNKNDLFCDIDKNNNSDESLQGNENLKIEGRNLDVKCNKIKVKKSKKVNSTFTEENFDIVINDHEKFFESLFGCYNSSAKVFDSTNIEEIISLNLQTNAENCVDVNKQPILTYAVNNVNSNDEDNTESYNDFCSQTDEETENCVTKICDKVPTIVESLGNEENRENSEKDFEHDDVTYELLCTVFGMKKLMENLIIRRVKIAKPDAFVVEHIDFLVTIIKRDKNKINPVYYYGHNYGFLNAELAFSTLQNNTGLYLIKI